VAAALGRKPRHYLWYVSCRRFDELYGEAVQLDPRQFM
jgi:hypothetical protein